MDYKKQCEEYEKRMGIGENDPAKEGYLVLVKILQQQNDYLKNLVIKDIIVSEEKGKLNEYERAKGLWEKLPNMIEAVSSLRISLKIDGEKSNDSKKPITPQSIAMLNGKM